MVPNTGSSDKQHHFFYKKFGLYMDNRIYPEIFFSKATHIIYQSFSRTFWGLGLGYIIYACETGNGGKVNYYIVKYKKMDHIKIAPK